MRLVCEFYFKEDSGHDLVGEDEDGISTVHHMHVRLHANNIEIWESDGRYRRTFVWRAQGKTIPAAVLQEIPVYQRPLLQEKVDRLIRGKFPEPLPSRDADVDAERFLEEATEMCSRLRWGRTTPLAVSQILVATVRLKEALAVSGTQLPKRYRRGRAAASKASDPTTLPP